MCGRVTEDLPLPPSFLSSFHPTHTQKIFKQMVLDEKAAIRARLKLKGNDVPLCGRMTEAQRAEDARVEALIDWRKVSGRGGGREGGREGVVYAFDRLLCRSFLSRHSLLVPPFHTPLPPSLSSLRTCASTTPSAFAPPLGPSSSSSPTGKTSWPLLLLSRQRRRRD